MARSIGDKGYEVVVRMIDRPEIIHPRTNLTNHVDVLLLVAAADIVCFAGTAFGEDYPERARMVLHMKPIAHVGAITVDG